MKSLLAATLMIMGAIFVSAFAICKTIIKYSSINGTVEELILLLIGGLLAMVAGIVLFVQQYKNKQ